MTDTTTTTQTEATETPAVDGGTLLTTPPAEAPVAGPETKPDEGAGEAKPDEGTGEKTPDVGEWKEYENDPAKSDEENAAAKAEHDKAKPAEEAPQGAPESYEDFTAPEGMQLDAETLDAFKEHAKANNLSQADAQKYVDMGTELLTKAAKAQFDEIVAVRQQWMDTTKGEFNDEQMATARRALDAYATPEFSKMLDATGLGNHPEMVRLLVNAGGSVTEDKIVSGNSSTDKPQTLAERLYGPTQKKTA